MNNYVNKSEKLFLFFRQSTGFPNKYLIAEKRHFLWVYPQFFIRMVIAWNPEDNCEVAKVERTFCDGLFELDARRHHITSVSMSMVSDCFEPSRP